MYTHDLSLALDEKDFRAKLDDRAELGQRMKWRYRLNWREPKRIMQLIRDHDLYYWLMLKGSVAEKLKMKFTEELREKSLKGRTVWDRIQKEIEEDPDGFETTDRDEWKPNAMKLIARKHQEDYNRQTFEDPLGIAVQQTLGIGLGFNFDYTKELMPGQKPTIRRLQARAAKSAIRRVQVLYDPEAKEKMLDGISDPQEREQKLRQLKRDIEEEVQYLARQLSNLVPRGSPDDFPMSEVKIFRHRKYSKISDYEYSAQDIFEDGLMTRIIKGVKDPRKGAANDVDEKIRGKTTSRKDSCKNPTGESEVVKKSAKNYTTIPTENDNEFVDAFVEQLRGEDDDDDHDGPTILLA